MFSLLPSGLNALVTPPLTPREANKNASSGTGDKGENNVGSNVVAAGLCAIVTLAYAGSFGQLVFDGELAPYVGRGILAALVSSVAVLFVLSWCSSLR